MDCLAGDREIRSWDYQKGLAEKAEADRKVRAAKDNVAAPTYCKSVGGEVPYTASSGACNSGDSVIDRAEYDRLRDQSRASLLAVPKLDEKKENNNVEELTGPTKPSTARKGSDVEEKAHVPPVPTLPEVERSQQVVDVFCVVIGSREVFATRAQKCPTGSAEISADAYSEGNIVSESDAMEVIAKLTGN